MKIGNKFQTLAAVGIMSLSLAAPAILAQSPTTQQSDSAKAGKRFGGHGGGREGHRGHRGGMGHIFAALNLTDAQKEQAKQIRESHKASLTAIRDQIRAMHQELRQSENGGTFNESLAAQKLAEIAPLQAKMMAEEFQIRQQMLGILTPEQKAKLDQMRSEWKAKRDEWKSKRAGSGAPQS
jgi:protein CpxP